MTRLLAGDLVSGITHCALGSGDATFVDPATPPTPTIAQEALHHEVCRVAAYQRVYLVQDDEGAVVVDGVAYRVSETPTDTVALYFRFDGQHANDVTLREYGIFGGSVAYRAGVTGSYAVNGVYHATTNTTGEVQDPGVLYEVRNIPDFSKFAGTTLEIVCVTRV